MYVGIWIKAGWASGWCIRAGGILPSSQLFTPEELARRKHYLWKKMRLKLEPLLNFT